MKRQGRRLETGSWKQEAKDGEKKRCELSAAAFTFCITVKCPGSLFFFFFGFSFLFFIIPSRFEEVLADLKKKVHTKQTVYI